MFAFQKWSSLAEMRRYMKRFIHFVDGLYKLGGVMRTTYNQYDSVVRPMVSFLEERGLQFETGREVVDVDFNLSSDKKTATVLHMKVGSEIVLGESDVEFIINGTLTESTDNGTWDTPAKLKGMAESGPWQVWKMVAAKGTAFGNPDRLRIPGPVRGGTQGLCAHRGVLGEDRVDGGVRLVRH